MKNYLGMFFLALVFTANAQPTLSVERYAESITAEQLKEHLNILASDEYEGRETGKAGQKKAAAYIADYYASLEIKPCNGDSYFQQYPLKKESLKKSIFRLSNVDFNYIEQFYFFPNFKESEVVMDEIVMVGYGIEDSAYSDYSNLDVSGKTILCFTGEPKNKKGLYYTTNSLEPSKWSGDFSHKIELAQLKGAKAILFINPDFKSFVSRIRYWLENPGMSLDYPVRNEEEGTTPFFFISPELADVILAEGKQKPALTIKKKIDAKGKSKSATFKSTGSVQVIRDVEGLSAENVLGYIEGTDPNLKDELVIISAHYDHIGINSKGEINNGADDDGSGTVSSLEIAEAFVKARSEGYGTRRSVLILNVSGEEKGLLGSEWYSEFPIFPLENTVCDLNIDMIGRQDEKHTDPNYVYLIGADKLSTDLHKISEQCNNDHTKLALDYTYNDPADPNRFYYRSDHYNFAKNNIPVIFYFSGVHEDYHAPGDDPEKILYDKMTVIAKLVFYTAWEIANRDEKLKVDVINNFE